MDALKSFLESECLCGKDIGPENLAALALETTVGSHGDQAIPNTAVYVWEAKRLGRVIQGAPGRLQGAP